MKHITITDSGYLAALPTSGPGLIVRSKVLKSVFTDATKAGWDVRVAGQHWGK